MDAGQGIRAQRIRNQLDFDPIRNAISIAVPKIRIGAVQGLRSNGQPVAIAIIGGVQPQAQVPREQMLRLPDRGRQQIIRRHIGGPGIAGRWVERHACGPAKLRVRLGKTELGEARIKTTRGVLELTLGDR